MLARIHVIDPDNRRRAQIANECTVRNLPTEVYDDLTEFGQNPPQQGFVFAVDDPLSGCAPGDILKALEASGTTLPVVMYANQPTPARIVSAMLEGALDYLEWPFNAVLLDTAFRRLGDEGAKRAARELRRVHADKAVKGLTSRETDVLRGLVGGLSNKMIARRLQISPRTVEIHRGNMMRKLDAQSTADAVRIALYARLDGGS